MGVISQHFHVHVEGDEEEGEEGGGEEEQEEEEMEDGLCTADCATNKSHKLYV